MITTLKAIEKHDPCSTVWRKLLPHLGKTEVDDEPLSIATILDNNGLDDALLCLRAVKGRDREIRLYAVWCARQVQHLMRDPRSLAALDVAERYANGMATDAELSDAEEAAMDAVEDARTSAWRADAWTAAWAANAAWTAAWAADAAWAAVDAAWAAAWAASSAAAWAAEEAAAETSAAAAAWYAARKQQGDKLREICLEVENE